MINDISNQERQSLADLLRSSGRSPDSFQAVLQPDGLVRVCGPRGTAFYPRAAWLQRFRTHLERSFFDPQVPLASGPRLPRKNATHASSGIPTAA